MLNKTIRSSDIRTGEGVEAYIQDKIGWIEQTLFISGDMLSDKEKVFFSGALRELHIIKGLK